jgi:hypothetical protein
MKSMHARHASDNLSVLHLEFQNYGGFIPHSTEKCEGLEKKCGEHAFT